MGLDYIIVQAGGKGTRMEYLTANKPKSLVPVNNLPMLFHLFQKYPEKRFIIIGDYKYDVLRRYLSAFAKVRYMLVDARGYQGTCAGLQDALRLIPKGQGFMLIWSDLILPDSFSMPEEAGDYVGISRDFSCRWKYENLRFEEERSTEHGVAGLFVFEDKQRLADVPQEGEFVRWLQAESMTPKELLLSKTKEYGLISEYNRLQISRCRPFNRLTENGERLIKEGIDEQGMRLAVREKAWYRFTEQTGFNKCPKIYSYEPFIMEKINGRNIFEFELTHEQKSNVLREIVNMLKELHQIGRTETDYFSMQEAYITKTFDRLEKVRDLIPFADRRTIRINGRECRNVFFCQEELESKLRCLEAKQFVVLHGDCTFSNMMLREETLEPLLIDPRGYFGYTEIYGDVAYDWAKLYYSIVGNYDKFNIKDFRLVIDEDEVTLTIASNGWEDMEQELLELISEDVTREQLQLIHAVIWLSLTTYAWEDYDSICGAFYNGLYYLGEVLS